MNELLISLDPGFDSIKVIANGSAIKFPFSVIKTDESKMQELRLKASFMRYRTETGQTWRVGRYARDLIYQDPGYKDEMESFYSEKRFTSEEFRVGLLTAVARAIDELGLYEIHKDIPIYMMVELPHAMQDKYTPLVKGAVTGKHTFYFARGTKDGIFDEKKYEFTIKENNVYVFSQTIATLYGETSDDTGNLDDEKFYLLAEGPTFVIDGGYYTVGVVPVSDGGTVNENSTISDTAHAGKNINELIEECLKDKRPDIKHYDIEYLLSKDSESSTDRSHFLKYMKDGKAQEIDLLALKAEKAEEMAEDFAAILDAKYNSFLDAKYVVVAGGSGAALYPFLKQHYVGKGVIAEDAFTLCSTMLNGRKLPIVFAVAIGGYKALTAAVADRE